MIKKNLITIICCAIIIVVLFNINKISDVLAKMLENNPPLVIEEANLYTKDYDFDFVKFSSDYVPYSYQDLLNITFTTINNGWKTFTFYCPDEYESCVDDMLEISDNSLLLTHLNNFVHPYNGFTNLNTTISSSGEITLSITYLYSEEEIEKINTEVDKIIASLELENDEDYDKLKKIHDYIINNTKYDEVRNETGNSEYESYKATDTLLKHYATCNGYTDTMAIILSKLGFKNFKVATTPEEISYESTGHIWNAVYFNNNWVHIDLTWDDPVSDDGKDYIYHKYFLVNNEEMAQADSGEVKIEEHNFDKTIYQEFKTEPISE